LGLIGVPGGANRPMSIITLSSIACCVIIVGFLEFSGSLPAQNR
jgi:hypothetical protein